MKKLKPKIRFTDEFNTFTFKEFPFKNVCSLQKTPHSRNPLTKFWIMAEDTTLEKSGTQLEDKELVRIGKDIYRIEFKGLKTHCANLYPVKLSTELEGLKVMSHNGTVTLTIPKEMTGKKYHIIKEKYRYRLNELSLATSSYPKKTIQKLK